MYLLFRAVFGPLLSCAHASMASATLPASADISFFRKLCFCRPHTNDRPPFSEGSSLGNIFENLPFLLIYISFFHRFRVNSRQECIKNYSF